MIPLWLGIALMTAAVAVAMAWPILKGAKLAPQREAFDVQVYRDQLKEVDREAERGLLTDAEAEAARIEIQRRLLAAADEVTDTPEDGAREKHAGAATLTVVAIVPAAAALAFYLVSGSPHLPDQPFAERNLPEAVAAGRDEIPAEAAPEIEAMVAGLAERLQSRPDDLRGWMMLGRSYLVLDRPEDALKAYKHAYGIDQTRPDVKLAYAETLVITQGLQVSPEASAIFRDVIEISPFEPKSRFYIGIEKAQGGDLKAALQDWIDLLAISPRDAPWVPLVLGQAQQAMAELGIDAADVAPTEEARRLAGELTRTLAEQSAAEAPPANVGKGLDLLGQQ